MSLVRDWRKQVARAAGVSLIGPLALLLAGALVAVGGGFGGLGSLGQIATGPPLPDTGLAQPPRVSVDGAAGAGPAGAADPIAAASAGSAPLAVDGGAPGAPGGGTAPGAPVTRLAPPGSTAPDPGAVSPPGGTNTPATAPAPGGGTGPPAAPTPPPSVPVPPPVPDMLEGPREIIESLPAPVGPLSDGVLDTITGPAAP